MRQLSLLYTGNQQCFNVRYSPFDSSLLACACNDKFGLTGASSLLILQNKESAFLESKFSIVESFKLPCSVFDCEWSPIDPTLLLTGNGDGSVSVWKWPTVNTLDRKSMLNKRSHLKEVHSAQWEPSGLRSYHFMSASWDQTIKIWNIGPSGLTELQTLMAHDFIIHAATWNPRSSGILLSVSGDKTFSIWDVNSSAHNNTTPHFKSPNRKSDILCCDWNKADANVFALGYASGLIEQWDFRQLAQGPVKSFEMAHDFAICKVKFSPHYRNLLGSVSYDMTTKLWHAEHGLMETSQNHSEFAYGLDFDPKVPDRLVDCGWDRRVMISEFQLDHQRYKF